jgi:hypothetical protein
VKVDVGVGHALVLVGSDVCVQSIAHAGIGYINVLGEESGGADVDDQRGTVRRAPGPKLILDADVGIGAIEVLHDESGTGPRGYRFDVGGQITPELGAAGCAGTLL